MNEENTLMENELLQRQISWLLCQLKYCNDNPHKEDASYGCCPPGREESCEFTRYNGVVERPDCDLCWKVNIQRSTL